MQDEWRILPNLTLNLGLRYDLQKIEQPTVLNPDPQLLAAGLRTNRIPEDHNNWGPRVGFAWTPRATTARSFARGTASSTAARPRS